MKKVYIDLTDNQLQRLKDNKQIEIEQEHYIINEDGKMTCDMIGVVVYNSKRDKMEESQNV